MIRKAATITATGTKRDGRTWCRLDKTIFRPGDTGRVGPFSLTGVERSRDGAVIHYLNVGADPDVGEVVGLVRDDDQSAVAV
jgi:hypothetical protein